MRQVSSKDVLTYFFSVMSLPHLAHFDMALTIYMALLQTSTRRILQA